MTPRMRRDLLSITGLAAAIVGVLVLVLVRIVSASTPATEAATATAEARPPSFTAGSTDAAALSAPSTRTPPSTDGPPDHLDGPRRTVQLTAGSPVTPAPPARVTPRAAPTTSLPTAMPTDPPTVPDPTAPDQVARAWLTTLCRYDYRQAESNTHQRLAQQYGDTTMPAGQDPFTLTDAAWITVRSGHLSSACINLAAVVDPAPPDHPGPVTVRLSATQLVAVNDTPTQQLHLTMTRTMNADTGGDWRVAGPITAN